MNPDERIEESRPVSRFVVGIAMLMALLYTLVGLFFLFKTHLFTDFSPTGLRIFGALLITYGFYRAYRVYKTYFVA